jgi:O-antigen/teichoic acid export membrane protein
VTVNILSNWLAMVLTEVTSFIVMPILIRGLGDFQYGLWALVGSVLDCYGLLDLGVRSTLHRYVGRYKGTGERQALNETVGTALAITCCVGVLVLALTAILVAVLPSLVSLPAGTRSTVRGLLGLLGVAIAVQFPCGVLGAYLCGMQRFDLYNASSVGVAILRSVATVVVVRMGYGLIAIGVATLASSCLWLIVNWCLVTWVDRTASISLRHANWARMKELSSFSIWAFVISVGDYLRFYTDSTVIARVLTIALVTPFSVAARLVQYVKQVVIGFVGPLMPLMSALEGRGELPEMRDLFLRSTRWTALLSLFLSVLLAANGEALLRHWLGPKFLVSYPLLIALLVGQVAELSQYPSNVVLLARSKHRAQGYWTLVEGFVNLCLSIYWGRKYGLIGIALGTTVPMLVTKMIVQPWYALRTLEVGAGAYIRKSLVRPAIVGVVFGAQWVMFRPMWQAASSLWALAQSVVIQSLIFLLLIWLVGLNADDRRAVVSRSRRAVVVLRAAA